MFYVKSPMPGKCGECPLEMDLPHSGSRHWCPAMGRWAPTDAERGGGRLPSCPLREARAGKGQGRALLAIPGEAPGMCAECPAEACIPGGESAYRCRFPGGGGTDMVRREGRPRGCPIAAYGQGKGSNVQ